MMIRHERCWKRAVKFCALMSFAVLWSGCATTKSKTKPVAWNLEVYKTVPASIEVDLIGINQLDRASWEAYDITKYWSPGDKRRSEQRKKLTKGLEHVTSEEDREKKSWVIDRKDEQWAKWLDEDKATELLVIANLPGTNFPTGLADPRRKFLPLDKKYWDAEKGKLEIEVLTTEIKIRTAPRR